MLNKYLIFDIGGTFVKWAIIDSKYNIYKKSKWKFDGKNDGKDVLMKDLSKKIISVEQEHEIDGIGISTAGTIDPKTQKVIGENNNIKNMDNADFINELKHATNKPIYVENDANAAILGESTLDKFKSFENILMITLGTGIGGGIIINNNIYHGSTGFAGEIGQQIYKGNCWEYYHSAIGLLRMIKEKNNVELTTYEILKSEDKKIIETRNIWYEGIAHVLANSINLMNFNAIIIGGGISESEEFDIELIRNKILDYLPLKQLHNTFKLFKASLGNSAAIVGMAKILNQKLIKWF